MKKSKIALIILAAGSSSRLGRPKQLLRRGDQTMINYIIDECKASGLGPTYLVTGRYHEEIVSQAEDVTVLHNESWQEGMSTSIAYGISNIDQNNLDGVIIILSDQVYFDRHILTRIESIAKIKSPKIINCKYQESMGPPTYFDKSLFPVLEQLSGDKGAKSIVANYMSESIPISFPKGNIDLDTESDLNALSRF